MYVIRVPEGQKEGGAERVLREIMTENFPNLARDTNIQNQEAEHTPNQINQKKSMPRYHRN